MCEEEGKGHLMDCHITNKSLTSPKENKTYWSLLGCFSEAVSGLESKCLCHPALLDHENHLSQETRKETERIPRIGNKS